MSTGQLEARVYPTAYAVSCLPPEHRDAYHFTIHVEWRNKDLWCVKNGAYCYDRDGVEEYESNPSSRTDEFKQRFRFPLDEALEIAKRVAPQMTVNGRSVQDVLAWGGGDRG